MESHLFRYSAIPYSAFYKFPEYYLIIYDKIQCITNNCIIINMSSYNMHQAPVTILIECTWIAGAFVLPVLLPHDTSV